MEDKADRDADVEVAAEEGMAAAEDKDNVFPALEVSVLAPLLVPDKEDRKDILDNLEDMAELEAEVAARNSLKELHNQSRRGLFFYKCSLNHPI